MLDHRFSFAPMMDWTDRAGKAMYNQHLSMVAIAMLYQMQYRAVGGHPPANEFRFSPRIWLLQRIAAYDANRGDCTPSECAILSRN